MNPHTAILICTGFRQPPHYTKSAGLWKIHDRLAQIFWDRREYWVGVRTWNDAVDRVADEFKRLGVKRVFFVGYSWGCGRAFIRFCKRLAELGMDVRLSCLIDPVIYDGLILGKAANAMLPTSKKFIVPENVRGFAVWRTTNKTWKDPMGRACKSAALGAQIVERVYGKERPGITHCTIEDAEDVQDEVVAMMTDWARW